MKAKNMLYCDYNNVLSVYNTQNICYDVDSV